MKALAKGLLGFLALAALLYLAACAFLYFKQRQLLYYPHAMPGAGAAAQPLRARGPRVLVSTHELAGPQAVVYFGGNAEDVSYTLPELRASFPAHALYLLHYRGYGGSEGEPTEAGLNEDALALFDQVHAKHPKVTMIGRSLGSGLAVRVASQRKVERLVLVTPYDSIVGVASGFYPYMPVSLLLRDRYESFRYAPRVRAPTLIIAAGHDEVIPRASTDLLLTRFAPGVASMRVLDGTGHNTVSDDPRYAALLSAP